MTDDAIRARIRALRELAGTSEASKWPTCLLCTEASRARYPPDGIWIPVGGYRVEPEFGKLAPPREVGMRGMFEVIATCHGDTQAARIHVPFWWGTAHILDAMRELMFFGRDKYVDHGMVTRIH